MEQFGVPVATGTFRVAWYLHYTKGTDPELKSIGMDDVYVKIPGNPLTTVVGGVAAVSTMAATYSVVNSAYSWLDLLRSLSSIYGISSKTRQIFQLPLLAIVAPLPIVDSLLNREGKKIKLSKKEFNDQVADRIRNRAIETWPATQCPNCYRKLKSAENCSKCNLSRTQMATQYGDRMVDLSRRSIAIVSKNQKTTVNQLRKKLKIGKKTASRLAGLLTEEGIFEMVGLKGPILKLLGNGMSLSFLMITWNQLYGNGAYGLVEIVGLVSAGFSVALVLGVLLHLRSNSKLKKAQSAILEQQSLGPSEEPMMEEDNQFRDPPEPEEPAMEEGEIEEPPEIEVPPEEPESVDEMDDGIDLPTEDKDLEPVDSEGDLSDDDEDLDTGFPPTDA
jgi:hypothetical protein